MKKTLRPGEIAVTARDIVSLLSARHAEDVFVPECKDGPTHGLSHMRMDAWAMKKSWAHPLVIGYEIKISRGDFLSDTKWHAYLNLCNELYFVCPQSMISPDELPAHVGLMYASATGGRLFIKRRAAYREVSIPEDLYRYILMCRARITPRWDSPKKDMKAYWQEWMKTKEVDREFGYTVGRSIREAVSKKITEVEIENLAMKKEIEKLQEVKAILDKLGLNARNIWLDEREILQKRQRMLSVIPPDLIRDLANANDTLSRSNDLLARVLNLFQELEKQPAAEAG